VTQPALVVAAFSAPSFGLPLFLLMERPGEHAATGGVTHFRRGWCHTPFPLFNQSLWGVQDVQNQPFKWAAKVANPVARGRCKIHGIRRSAVALFCASLRHLSGPVKLRLGEMSVMVLSCFGRTLGLLEKGDLAARRANQHEAA
jgi:hypothetical protein